MGDKDRSHTITDRAWTFTGSVRFSLENSDRKLLTAGSVWKKHSNPDGDAGIQVPVRKIC